MSRPGGSHTDFLAAAVFIGLGGLGLWAGRDLPMGQAASMGPGYVPNVVSILILLIGLGVLALGFRRAERLDVIRLKPLAILVLAVAGFALAADLLGFVLASAWLVGVGSLADREWRGREVLLSMLVLTAFGALVFILGLQVQMTLGPP